MIQAIANRMAGFVVKNDDTANYEVLAYGFGLIVSGIATYTVVITSALLFGVIKEMLISVLVYLTMRLMIGGAHASSRAVCFITYSGTLYLCIYLSSVLYLTDIAIAALYIADVILLILYAPGDTVEQPIVKRRLMRKMFGLIFLSIFFAFAFFNRDMQTEMNLLTLVSTLTCVFLHPFIYKIYRCRKSNIKKE